ncbi:type II secretion system F family protein [Nocardia sp. 2]|uniref:Type II secretion system F family protein n=2 Tax=Nocardia acididurans TaxID=2802282 RepID=A0ABS1M9R9_9NOCA|nr:type II secretion system F family protein [Nocardia acididurans]
MIAATLASATFVVRRGRAAREARRKAESVRLLEGLETVISELRVGAHPSAAAEAAAREIAVADAMRGTPDGSPVPGEPLRVAGGRAAVGGLPHGVGARISPGVTAAGGSAGDVARAFSVSAARSRLGGSGAEALRRPDSVVAVELSRLAEAWQVAESHGLALAELLAAARADLQGRNRFRERTRAALAGARATAAVLAGLPLLGVGLGQLMGAAPLLVLFDSAAGTLLLPLGVGLACAGLLWTDAITARVLR